MSFKHIVLFALLAFVAVQGATTDLRVKNPNAPSSFGLISIARRAIEKLVQIIQIAVDAALNTLRGIGQAIVGAAKLVVEQATRAILEEIQRIRDEITAIQDQAIELGIDIGECLEENQNALQELPKRTIANIVQCATDEVARAEAIIDSAISEIVEIKDTVVDMPADLNDCIHSWRPITCTTRLIADVVDAINSIPAVIRGKVNEVIRLVSNIESDLKTCVTSRVLEASAEAAAISARVAKCVAEKIREHADSLE